MPNESSPRFDPRYDPIFQRGYSPGASGSGRPTLVPTSLATSAPPSAPDLDRLFPDDGSERPAADAAPRDETAAPAPDPQPPRATVTLAGNPFLRGLWIAAIALVACGVLACIASESVYTSASGFSGPHVLVLTRLLGDVGPALIVGGILAGLALVVVHAVAWHPAPGADGREGSDDSAARPGTPDPGPRAVPAHADAARARVSAGSAGTRR